MEGDNQINRNLNGMHFQNYFKIKLLHRITNLMQADVLVPFTIGYFNQIVQGELFDLIGNMIFWPGGDSEFRVAGEKRVTVPFHRFVVLQFEGLELVFNCFGGSEHHSEYLTGIGLVAGWEALETFHIATVEQGVRSKLTFEYEAQTVGEQLFEFLGICFCGICCLPLIAGLAGHTFIERAGAHQLKFSFCVIVEGYLFLNKVPLDN